ncbi:MAG: PrgI family protein [Candidatus Woesebacteria bacterium]
MQEHPVPQNVTGYEFHLIGQMTLKQFLEVAGGILGAVLINMTNLPGIIKYPLMVISALLGAALAFIPLEGRPLDRWFFAFIKSIYQPTLFFWKKTNTVPGAFTYTQPITVDTTPSVDYGPIRKSRVQEFIQTTTSEPKLISDEETKAAEDVLKLFSEPSPTPTGRILEMNVVPSPTAPAPISPAPVPAPPPPAQTTVFNQNTPIGYAEKQGVTSEHLPLKAAESNTPITPGKLETVYSAAPDTTSMTGLQPVPTLSGFPFPNKPTTPNVVAGMVVSSDNKIIENAIITILRESDHTPVRAMKTNTLGQFAVVTPLDTASYRISVEKDGYSFDNYSLVLNNQVVAPVLLKAK